MSRKYNQILLSRDGFNILHVYQFFFLIIVAWFHLHNAVWFTERIYVAHYDLSRCSQEKLYTYKSRVASVDALCISWRSKSMDDEEFGKSSLLFC